MSQIDLRITTELHVYIYWDSPIVTRERERDRERIRDRVGGGGGSAGGTGDKLS